MVDNHKVDRAFVTLERAKNAHVRTPFFFKWHALSVGDVSQNCLILVSPVDGTSDGLVLVEVDNVSRVVKCGARLQGPMHATYRFGLVHAFVSQRIFCVGKQVPEKKNVIVWRGHISRLQR